MTKHPKLNASRTTTPPDLAVRFTGALAAEGSSPSVGTFGDTYVNVLMETINGPYKAECIRSCVFSPEVLEPVVDAEIATSWWAHWYNTLRLQSS